MKYRRTPQNSYQKCSFPTQMKKYFPKRLSADDLLHCGTFIIAASTASQTLIEWWKPQSLSQGPGNHLNAKFLATNHCLKQIKNHYFKKMFTWQKCADLGWIWLIHFSQTAHMTEKLLHTQLKHPGRVFRNAMRKEPAYIPHFPPLPNHNIIFIGSLAFGKSFVSFASYWCISKWPKCSFLLEYGFLIPVIYSAQNSGAENLGGLDGLYHHNWESHCF